MTESLQEDRDERHQRLHETKLQRGLLAEAQEADRVRFTAETTRSVQAARPYRLSPNLRHDVPLAAQVFVTQRQEVVNDERWNRKCGPSRYTC